MRLFSKGGVFLVCMILTYWENFFSELLHGNVQQYGKWGAVMEVLNMIQIYANNNTTISLGRQGENLARQVVFDLSDWLSGYGDGVAELIYQRPADKNPYPVAAIREGGTLVWNVSGLDTAAASSLRNSGHCELRWYMGDVLVKSQMWRTWVEPAMDTPSDTAPPDPEQGWVDQVLATGSAVQQAAAVASKAQVEAKQAQKKVEAAVIHAPKVQNGNWWVFNQSSGAYEDSGVPATGPVRTAVASGHGCGAQRPLCGLTAIPI